MHAFYREQILVEMAKIFIFFLSPKKIFFKELRSEMKIEFKNIIVQTFVLTTF